MAFPFDPAPTLRQYLDWARNAGCTVHPGLWNDQYFNPHRTIDIDAPGGGHVAILDPDQDEHLILLCHKTILRVSRWQHGQRGRVLAMARAIATRTDVIEVGI